MTEGVNPRRHLRITEPSPWVRRFAPLIPKTGPVLDLACGGGRHAGLLLEAGHDVFACDKDTVAIRERLADEDRLEVADIDLEDGAPPFASPSPLAGRQFAGIVVVNYLHRPLFGPLRDALMPGGVLIYETFGRGNEVFGKPRNPDHLLEAGELLAAFGGLRIVAYECGLVRDAELPGVKQRLCAVNAAADAEAPDLAPGER